MELGKVFKRYEIQQILTTAFKVALAESGVDPTPDHLRRTLRAMLRIVARVILDNGGSAVDFIGMASEAWNQECSKESGSPEFAAVPVAKAMA